MSVMGYIIWTANPEIFSIPGINYAPRWYGLLFASGFIIGQRIFVHIFNKEGKPEKDLDKLLGYMVAATIIGARLGHCLFYNPSFYLSNPIEILKVWEGGLASHGGAIGILVAIYLFCKKYDYQYLWVLDRMVIVVALTGALIRTGNLFNSEMEGTLTNSNFGIIYARATYDLINYNEDIIDDIDFEKGGELESDQSGVVPITIRITYEDDYGFGVKDKLFIENQLAGSLNRYIEVVQHVSLGEGPIKYRQLEEDGSTIIEIAALGKIRHAGQMYEATYCILLMVVLYWLWDKKRQVLPRGFNFALFMIVLWSLRFVDEFFKMNQEAFEEDLVLNMGQILSIPLTLAGVVIMVLVYRGSKKMSDG